MTHFINPGRNGLRIISHSIVRITAGLLSKIAEFDAKDDLKHKNLIKTISVMRRSLHFSLESYVKTICVQQNPTHIKPQEVLQLFQKC